MATPRTKARATLISILLLTIGGALIVFNTQLTATGFPVPSWLRLPFNLGLDLQGGTNLLYQADMSSIPASDQAAAIEGVRDVIDRRVNAFGVAEPVIQALHTGDNWRISAELAGVHDVNQAIKMIGETPLLEFKEQDPNGTTDFNKAAEKKAQDILKEVLKPKADFAALAKKYSEDSSASAGGDLGFTKRGVFVPAFEKTCFDTLKVGQTATTLTTSQFGYHIIRKLEERGKDATYEVRCQHILINTKTGESWAYTGLTGKQLSHAQVQFDPNTQAPVIALEFDSEGQKLFGEITQRNIGKPVGIFLDGNPISVPTVQEAITDGKALISGRFTITEAKLLAQRLNAGALPVPISLISQETIGPSLGNQSVQKSLIAGLIGLLAVALFMTLYYRLPGLVSVVGLLFYGLIVLSVFKIIPVTLTLASIAGFILSIGMAVDANVLIFERIREELRTNKPLSLAIDDGFKRAWPSIFDGNMSTLITCFILLEFTTSIVRGFAVTLIIGIFTSMFSAVIVVRALLKLVIKLKPLTAPWLFGVRQTNTHATHR